MEGRFVKSIKPIFLALILISLFYLSIPKSNAHEFQFINSSLFLDGDPTYDNSAPITTYDQFIDGELSTINTTINLNDTIMDFTGTLRNEQVHFLLPYVSTYIYFHVNTAENGSMFFYVGEGGMPASYDWTFDFFIDYELYIDFNGTNALIYVNNNLMHITTVNYEVSYTTNISGDYILTEENNVTINYSYFPRVVQTTSNLTNTDYTTTTITEVENITNTEYLEVTSTVATTANYTETESVISSYTTTLTETKTKTKNNTNRSPGYQMYIVLFGLFSVRYLFSISHKKIKSA
ncbi:MAG: hypothetical protein HeimC2_45710 [Candidatus Heimdallarchaeota archaeon LC_2]|nr:MAG: hypothetical protein HeimC2_45710 [Candidatus Heimdallarchaeota archaeon LC_2]